MKRAFEPREIFVAPARRGVGIEPARGETIGQSELESGARSGDISCSGFAQRSKRFPAGREINAQRLSFAPILRDLQHGRTAEALMRDEHGLAKGVAIRGGDDLRGDARQVAIILAIGIVEE